MPHNLFGAIGYLAIFLPFVLLIVGQAIDAPYLAAAIIFGVGPLSRPLLGNVSQELVEWDERTATFLDRLPVVYAAAFPLLLGWVLSSLGAHPPSRMLSWIWLGLSLWTCMFFAVVVAHELIHQGGLSAGFWPVLPAIHCWRMSICRITVRPGMSTLRNGRVGMNRCGALLHVALFG